MPTTSQSDTPSPPPKPPTCPACGNAMRLATAQPFPRYINLDECTYVCDCGQTMSNLLAHKA
jgi:hypothetical protein